MHIGSRQFLQNTEKVYPTHFRDAKVLELGSLDVNGTARDYFKNCEYVGIDRVAGPCVDLVVEAKDTKFEQGWFDTIVCVSTLEHDPTWKLTISHNLQWLRSGGLVVLGWGAEGCPYHHPDPFAVVESSQMREFVATLPLVNIDLYAEGSRYMPDCPGIWNLTALKVCNDNVDSV